MRDLSVKGIARRYAGETGDISVRDDIFTGVISGTVSLRNRLESMARQEFSFAMAECIYGWTAAFEQTWTHIVIRIRLNPDAGITNATMQALRNTWQNGIETTWSNRWGCARSGEIRCPLTFDVQWVTNSQHHTVRVRQGPAGTNMTTWDTADSGGVAAHEFGHMHGLVDEYQSGTCPARNPVNTGTVMDNNSNNVPSRMMGRFADNLDSNVVSL